ncbi:Wzt carbohydrate-binding domain-containing protein, partial [Acinetobacter baumannii]
MDVRRDKINASNLRNDLQVFTFDPEAAALGSGGAAITDVSFVGEDGERLNWVVGGEAVTLAISITAVDSLRSPIVGF